MFWIALELRRSKMGFIIKLSLPVQELIEFKRKIVATSGNTGCAAVNAAHPSSVTGGTWCEKEDFNGMAHADWVLKSRSNVLLETCTLSGYQPDIKGLKNRYQEKIGQIWGIWQTLSDYQTYLLVIPADVSQIPVDCRQRIIKLKNRWEQPFFEQIQRPDIKAFFYTGYHELSPSDLNSLEN